MAPPIPAVAQSESKAKFLDRLRIPHDSEEGRKVYAMMKEEAATGRARMSAHPDCLIPQLRHDPSVRPPYSNVQISETALHREMLEIYRLARPETRRYYDLAHDTAGLNVENWVIKWLLWHVFRYRDNRNRGRANTASGGEAESPNREAYMPSHNEQERKWRLLPVMQTSPLTSHSVSFARPAYGGGTGSYYDPVRDTQRNS